MKKKILFCIVFILGFIKPINAAKLYTTHWSNQPVVFYIVDTLGRHRNRVIVYPNSLNKGISVTYLSERHGGRLFLFSEPTNESSIIGITTIEQAALVMDAHGT